MDILKKKRLLRAPVVNFVGVVCSKFSCRHLTQSDESANMLSDLFHDERVEPHRPEILLEQE